MCKQSWHRWSNMSMFTRHWLTSYCCSWVVLQQASVPPAIETSLWAPKCRGCRRVSRSLPGLYWTHSIVSQRLCWCWDRIINACTCCSWLPVWDSVHYGTTLRPAPPTRQLPATYGYQVVLDLLQLRHQQTQLGSEGVVRLQQSARCHPWRAHCRHRGSRSHQCTCCRLLCSNGTSSYSTCWDTLCHKLCHSHLTPHTAQDSSHPQKRVRAGGVQSISEHHFVLVPQIL